MISKVIQELIKQFIDSIKCIPKTPDNLLKQNILGTYSTVRWTMVVLGVILPLLLVFGGLNRWFWLENPLEIQDSLSAYYHAGGCTLKNGVYRDLFVGLLCAISACLIIYRGFGSLENWLLNFAGIFLLGVAWFPTGWSQSQIPDTCPIVSNVGFEASQLFGFPIAIHGVSAVLFFAMIIAVNFCTAMDTLEEDKNDTEEMKEIKETWKNIFRFTQYLMIFYFIIAIVTGLLIGKIILWIEWAGIYAFAIYWFLKSLEILSTHVDENLLE